jgi:cell division septal protein FtsQ
MSKGRVEMGFKPEVLRTLQAGRARSRPAFPLRLTVILAGLLVVGTALIMTTDLEELLLPRTIIVRGNRLSESREILAMAGLPARLGLRSLLPETRRIPEERSRWVRTLKTRSMFGRRLLLSVDERLPVLPLEVAGQPYWICSDGEIVRRDMALDVDETFVALNKLPLVSMADSGIDAEYEVAEMLLLTAACCRELLNGRIKSIQVEQTGSLNLSTDRGLVVQLGIPPDEEQLRLRMSALAKAIRISDDYKDATGIDMRNGKVAYLRTKATE